MKTVKVKLGRESYPIYIGSRLLQELPSLLKREGLSASCRVISDETVASLYGNDLCGLLQRHGLETRLYTVPPGEQSKSIDTLQALYNQMLGDGVDRRNVVIALGGGVVGDLAGFVAATLLRGLRLVQVPTTLLAQTDSSVGGKVGINHPRGKNLIGAFYQPKMVVIDSETLKTLPPRQIRAGAAEVIKYGFIRSRSFFERVADRLDELFALGDEKLLETVLETACSIKAEITSRDERESGLRAILNFGHTFGHALETATGYSVLLHGEAVVYGMTAALRLSQRFGRLKEDVEALTDLLRRFEPPPLPSELTAERIVDAMAGDKKRLSSVQQWVLLKAVGRAFISREVPQNAVLEEAERLLATSKRSS